MTILNIYLLGVLVTWLLTKILEWSGSDDWTTIMIRAAFSVFSWVGFIVLSIIYLFDKIEETDFWNKKPPKWL